MRTEKIPLKVGEVYICKRYINNQNDITRKFNREVLSIGKFKEGEVEWMDGFSTFISNWCLESTFRNSYIIK